MKILHTTDWLIGGGISGPLFLTAQVQVLKEIVSIAEEEQVDAVMLSGLIGPEPPEEIALNFLQVFIAQLNAGGTVPVFIVAGNKDTLLKTTFAQQQQKGVFVLHSLYDVPPPGEYGETTILASETGYVEFSTVRMPTPTRLLFIPNSTEEHILELSPRKKKNVAVESLIKDHLRNLAKKRCTANGHNILFLHAVMKQNVSKQPERAGDEEEPLLTFTPSVIPPQIQYCALGGIHKAQAVVKKPVPAIYAGNPYLVIPDMEKHNKYVAIIEIAAQKPANYRAVRLHSSKPMFSVDAHNFPEAAHKITEYPDALIYLTVLPERPIPVKECRNFLEEHPSIVALICPIDYKDETSNNKKQNINQPSSSGKEVISESIEPITEHVSVVEQTVVSEAEDDMEQRPAEQQALLQEIISIPALQTNATALLREFHEQLFTEPASEELVFVFEELLLEKGAKD